jgi:hypothetical protein
MSPVIVSTPACKKVVKKPNPVHNINDDDDGVDLGTLAGHLKATVCSQILYLALTDVGQGADSTFEGSYAADETQLYDEDTGDFEGESLVPTPIQNHAHADRKSII